jgi:predicted RNase H-like HicB family nuclease
MKYSVCLEEVETRWVGHVLELPGCFSSTNEQKEAIAQIPQAISQYYAWVKDHGGQYHSDSSDTTLDILEIAREWAFPPHPDYVVNAFFASDAEPLREDEINNLLLFLEWSYHDLLESSHGLSQKIMHTKVEDEWDIEGILCHTSRAAWWYLDRLDMAPKPETEPKTWLESLEMTKDQLAAILPKLAGMSKIEMDQGELWSPRKMVRRSLWHLRDHTAHIYQFRSRLGV